MHSRQKRRMWVALGGAALLTGVYVRRLASMRLKVVAGEALQNGDRMLASGKNVLAVTAHPDDLEIFMGGTLKLLSEQGCRVTVIDVTNGEKGVRRRNLAELRQKEQQQAAEVLEVAEVRFLHLPDLKLDHKEEKLRQTLAEQIKAIKPDVVYAFDYVFPLRAIIHPDHVTVGRVVADVANSQLAGRAPVYYYATRSPDAVVDIAETLNEKIAAVRCHKSQLRFDDRIYNRLTAWWARYTAVGTGIRYAECFRLNPYWH